MELPHAKEAEYSHHPSPHLMSQYTYLHGGGKKNTDGSGPILPGICCSATQWSFKGETSGSFWIWSQHEQMCHGTAFQPWHFLFFMDVIWYFSHTICGINGLHSRNSVLLHCCFQPGSHCGCEHLSRHREILVSSLEDWHYIAAIFERFPSLPG